MANSPTLVVSEPQHLDYVSNFLSSMPKRSTTLVLHGRMEKAIIAATRKLGCVLVQIFTSVGMYTQGQSEIYNNVLYVSKGVELEEGNRRDHFGFILEVKEQGGFSDDEMISFGWGKMRLQYGYQKGWEKKIAKANDELSYQLFGDGADFHVANL